MWYETYVCQNIIYLVKFKFTWNSCFYLLHVTTLCMKAVVSKIEFKPVIGD